MSSHSSARSSPPSRGSPDRKEAPVNRYLARRAGAPAGGLILALVAAACSGDDPVPLTQEAGDTAPASAPAASDVFPDWPNTDFSKTTIDLGEVLRGCPSRDCIPALDADGAVEVPSAKGGHARFAPASEADFSPRLPVAVVTVEGITKAYPLHVLTWHEVVNDRFGEVPVAVTFCPLCNTAISFDRRVDGRTLDFGVSGNLRNSDLIMWDRQTESWWQQATGEGIAGEMAGTTLTPIPTSIVAFGEFVAAFPQALTLTEDTGFGRSYGINPYEGYDGSTSPFLFSGVLDPRLGALDRVLTLDRSGDGLAVPLAALAASRVANLIAGGEKVVAFWAPGTASALDAADIANARDVGSGVAYQATLGGRDLTFRPGDSDATFIDDQTGSRWSIFGTAVSGPLAGSQLEQVFHTTEFWFAWAAFHPETSIWEEGSANRGQAPAPLAPAAASSRLPAPRALVTPAGSRDPEFCLAGGLRYLCWQGESEPQ